MALRIQKYTWGSEAYAGIIISDYANSLEVMQAAWADLQPHFPKTKLSEVEIAVSMMPGKCRCRALLFPTHGVAVPAEFSRIQSSQFLTA